MKMTNNTILITGGTSGIGLELAERFLKIGNTVIVTGRDPKKLEITKAKLPAIHTIQSDVSQPKEIEALYKEVVVRFPELNVLINNAGIMRTIDMNSGEHGLVDLTREIEINLIGPMHMIKQFLPHLKSKKSATIINVSSGLAFTPYPTAPIYSAAKAGLHSFTQSLRLQLKNTTVRVIELAPPAIDTPLADGMVEDMTEKQKAASKSGLMSAASLVSHALKGFESDNLEIRPGLSKVLKWLSRIAPQSGPKLLFGRTVDQMLARSKSL